MCGSGELECEAPRNRFNLFTAHPSVNSKSRSEVKPHKLCTQKGFKWSKCNFTNATIPQSILAFSFTDSLRFKTHLIVTSLCGWIYEKPKCNFSK